MQEGGLPRPPRPAWQLGWRSPLKIEQPDVMLTLREHEPEVGPGVGGTVGKTLPRSPSSLLAQLQDICPQQQQLPGGAGTPLLGHRILAASQAHRYLEQIAEKGHAVCPSALGQTACVGTPHCLIAPWPSLDSSGKVSPSTAPHHRGGTPPVFTPLAPVDAAKPGCPLQGAAARGTPCRGLPGPATTLGRRRGARRTRGRHH